MSVDFFGESDPFAEAEYLAVKVIESYGVGGGVPPAAFENGLDSLLENVNEVTRRHILRTLGVINVTPGRNGPAVVAQNAQDVYPRVLATAREIWAQLRSNNGRLSSSDLDLIVQRSGYQFDEIRNPVKLVKQLGLAVGVQRSGGLQSIDLATEKAFHKLENLPVPPSNEESAIAKETKLENDRESAYYDFIASFIDGWDSYEAAIVGGQQIGRGEWSTPDIIAISVSLAPSLIFPIVRIATVEVKLEISRLAIAEASAHKRFSHYTYIGVPQAPVDMDLLIVAELAAAGLGLICPRQRGSLTFHVYLEAQFNRPDEEDLEQLLQNFRTSEGVSMSKVTHDRARKALTVLFDS